MAAAKCVWGIAMVPKAKKAANSKVQKGTVNSVTDGGVSGAAATSVKGDKVIVDNTRTNGNDAKVTAAVFAPPPQETLRTVYGDVRVQLQANQVTRERRVRYTSEYTIYRPKLTI